jgi:gliding motility-associated lipoprotein GldD
MLKNTLYFAVLLSLSACFSKKTEDFQPKPSGYNRIDLPEASYQPLSEQHPYSFEFSKEAVIKPDTFRGAEPHWIFVHYPRFNADIQLTYKQVQNNPKRLAGFISDAHKLAAKHNIKAYSIGQAVLQTRMGKTAALFEIDGEVPSQLQFYTTDSSTHYLRGALYFKTALRNDSLAPVISYIKKDIVHMLNTLEWKKGK